MIRNRGASSTAASTGLRSSQVSQRSDDIDDKNKANVLLQRNLFIAISLMLACLLLFVFMSDNRGVNIACHSRTPIMHDNKLRDSTKATETNSNPCEMTFGSYRGHEYATIEGGTVGKPKCLVESKWLKLSQHTVKFPGSNTIIDDWMWIDYHDRINVLVEDERKQQEERQFLIFEQSKYALEGRSSLAIIGGIIELDETPEQAARREVEEEMNGLQCNNFHFLGRYRTDVNRGMGWLNSFLATDCYRPSGDSKHGIPVHESNADEIGQADTERQDLKRITLSKLKESVRNGEFLEVQWSATIALALQHPELM